MKSVSFRLNAQELDRLDELVAESDHFDKRSQAIRYAIRRLLQRHAAGGGEFVVQSTPTERVHADTILDYLDDELGARNVEWAVVPATEVDDE